MKSPIRTKTLAGVGQGGILEDLKIEPSTGLGVHCFECLCIFYISCDKIPIRYTLFVTFKPFEKEQNILVREHATHLCFDLSPIPVATRTRMGQNKQEGEVANRAAWRGVRSKVSIVIDDAL